MQIIVKQTRTISKILKKRDVAAHRRMHLKRAQFIREDAERYKDDMMRQQIEETGSRFIPDSIMEEIDTQYHNMLSEALAEENAKCMGKH